MNKEGRVENSIKNSIWGVAVQASSVVLGLVVRTFFIRFLAQEYLGVNGLFTNILTVLSLAEMGVGSAIVYNMYKPIADSDEIQIAKLMNFYKQAYTAIGVVVAVVGLAITPFLSVTIKNAPAIPDLQLIYLMYLCNTVMSYFFAYKKSILSADQRERNINAFRLVFCFVKSIFQVAVLIIWRSFILYLAIQIISTILENISVSFYVDKQYPFLRQYRREKLSRVEKKPIIENVKALFIYKIGSTALDGTDNIIISTFDGLISVGLLSNYSLVTSSVEMLVRQVSGSLVGSVGNYVAKEEKSKHEELLNKITFLNFVVYGFAFVGLTACLTPFVKIWAGEQFVLGFMVVFVHCLNFYIYGMMSSIWTFRSTMGLFVHGKWRPLISAIINIVVSIILAKQMGLLGVLLGTTITRALTNVWYDPYIVFKYGLNKTPVYFYLTWLKYLVVVCVQAVIIQFVSHAVSLSGFALLIFNALFSMVLFPVSTFLLFKNRPECSYFIGLLQRVYIRVVGHKNDVV